LRRDLGDFQTPALLVEEVLKVLATTGGGWSRVLEPTCGQGEFLRQVSRLVPSGSELVGLEVQESYVKAARHSLADLKQYQVRVIRANIFEVDFATDLSWRTNGPLLVIGNPPWVTNEELSRLRSTNLPRKENLKGLKGMDAKTGGSNFDIAEYVWLKLLRDLIPQNPTIALLCKTAVARNVIQFAEVSRWPIAKAELWRIDASKWFEASVQAGLFVVTVDDSSQPIYQVKVYDELKPKASLECIFASMEGRLISNLESFASISHFEGASPVTWRQGIKHDAAEVMELRKVDNELFNKRGEQVPIEEDFVYPLLKSSDINAGRHASPKLRVIVTQRSLSEDTSRIQESAPRLWEYLTERQEVFTRRRSSIYIAKPPFSMFGVGDYTFAKYKVAVSGLYKPPCFRFLSPVEGRPVLVDDTCYFIPCRTPVQAAILYALLRSSEALSLIRSLYFPDAKRPITKKLLQRIDLRALYNRLDWDNLRASAAGVLRDEGIDATLPVEKLHPSEVFALFESRGQTSLEMVEPPRSGAVSGPLRSEA